MKNNHFKNNKKRAFTLIELLVAVSLFTTVTVSTIGSFFLISDANKKMQAIRAVVDNLNFAVEDITRNIRTGRDYQCGFTIDAYNKVLAPAVYSTDPMFCQGTNNLRIEGSTGGGNTKKCYLYVEAINPSGKKTIKYSESKLISFVNDCPKDPSMWLDATEIVSPEVEISSLKFYVVKSTNQQPIVIISLNGEFVVGSLGNKFKTPFNVQTTVSQRSIVSEF